MTDRHLLTPEEGISADGYITDQDCFSSVRYRGMRADINGCGWIAAYNLRHALGQEADWDEVRQEMDAMHMLRFPGPTLMRIMRSYLAKYVPDYRETAGREEAAQAAKESFRRDLPLPGRARTALHQLCAPAGRAVPLLQRDGRPGGQRDEHGGLCRRAPAARHRDRTHCR